MSSKFPGRRWSRADIEQLARDITDLPVAVKFVSFKSIKGYVAMAYATDPTDPLDTDVPRMEFAARIFREPLIWHECCHLLFPDWDTQDHTKKERNCHIKAVQLALDRGRPDIADKLLEATYHWHYAPHKKAGVMVRKYFGYKITAEKETRQTPY